MDGAAPVRLGMEGLLVGFRGPPGRRGRVLRLLFAEGGDLAWGDSASGRFAASSEGDGGCDIGQETRRMASESAKPKTAFYAIAACLPGYGR